MKEKWEATCCQTLSPVSTNTVDTGDNGVRRIWTRIHHLFMVVSSFIYLLIYLFSIFLDWVKTHHKWLNIPVQSSYFAAVGSSLSMYTAHSSNLCLLNFCPLKTVQDVSALIQCDGGDITAECVRFPVQFSQSILTRDTKGKEWRRCSDMTWPDTNVHLLPAVTIHFLVLI